MIACQSRNTACVCGVLVCAISQGELFLLASLVRANGHQPLTKDNKFVIKRLKEETDSPAGQDAAKTNKQKKKLKERKCQEE